MVEAVHHHRPTLKQVSKDHIIDHASLSTKSCSKTNLLNQNMPRNPLLKSVQKVRLSYLHHLCLISSSRTHSAYKSKIGRCEHRCTGSPEQTQHAKANSRRKACRTHRFDTYIQRGGRCSSHRCSHFTVRGCLYGGCCSCPRDICFGGSRWRRRGFTNMVYKVRPRVVLCIQEFTTSTERIVSRRRCSSSQLDMADHGKHSMLPKQLTTSFVCSARLSR